MDQEYEVIEVEMDTAYYQVLRKLAFREGLSLEQYLLRTVSRYMETYKERSPQREE